MRRPGQRDRVAARRPAHAGQERPLRRPGAVLLLTTTGLVAGFSAPSACLVCARLVVVVAQPVPGEDWIYRKRDGDPSLRVCVVSTHSHKQGYRAMVEYVGGELAGRRETCPAAGSRDAGAT